MTHARIPSSFVLAAALASLVLVLSACQGQAEPTSVAPVRVDSAPVEVALSDQPDPVLSPASPATATPSPVPTATPSPTATATPSPPPAPTATPTATPVPQPVQLTSGACCTQPFWSPDSQQVRFIDKPGPDQSVGIYGVSIAQPLAAPVLISERVEDSIPVADFVVQTDGNTTVIERVADGERWTVPAGGETVLISPDQTRIAWSASDDSVAPEFRVATIWVANLDGSNARQVTTLPRGGLSGWISDDALLISGRETLQTSEQYVAALQLADGTVTELARADRLRSTELSPTGQWLAYYGTFSPEPERNGLWLVRTDGSQQIALDREFFGAYQWRPCAGDCSDQDDRLLIVPFRPEAQFHELWELNAVTGALQPVTDPALTPFKIANGDWRVSPDGRYIVYVESSDRNIWVLALPE